MIKRILLSVIVSLVTVEVQASDYSEEQMAEFAALNRGINHSEAHSQCDAQRKRLPTARELAVEAVKNGAEILELNQVSPDNTPEGFDLISVINLADHTRDEFYYSTKNYRYPGPLPWREAIKVQLTWSSSMPDFNGAYGRAYLFDNLSGYLRDDLMRIGHKVGVRCVTFSRQNR